MITSHVTKRLAADYRPDGINISQNLNTVHKTSNGRFSLWSPIQSRHRKVRKVTQSNDKSVCFSPLNSLIKEDHKRIRQTSVFDKSYLRISTSSGCTSIFSGLPISPIGIHWIWRIIYCSNPLKRVIIRFPTFAVMFVWICHCLVVCRSCLHNNEVSLRVIPVDVVCEDEDGLGLDRCINGHLHGFTVRKLTASYLLDFVYDAKNVS